MHIPTVSKRGKDKKKKKGFRKFRLYNYMNTFSEGTSIWILKKSYVCLSFIIDYQIIWLK